MKTPTKGQIKLGSILIDVKILEIKISYGRTRYLITPVSGIGEQWVEKLIIL